MQSSMKYFYLENTTNNYKRIFKTDYIYTISVAFTILTPKIMAI